MVNEKYIKDILKEEPIKDKIDVGDFAISMESNGYLNFVDWNIPVHVGITKKEGKKLRDFLNKNYPK